MSEEVRKIKVLICDDDPADRSLVRQLLKVTPGHEFELIEVADGRGLPETLAEVRPDVIILDVQLPGVSGLECLKDIAPLEIAPVIMATGHGDEMIAVEAMKSGAYDYLPKMHFSTSSLSRTIINAMERWGLERQVQEYRKKLVVMAMIDELTGILNRSSLIENIRQGVDGCLQGGECVSLVMLDVDHFKRVNDKYGHDVGDVVLKGVCRAVERALGDGDVFGRYGGEEFMVILHGSSLEQAVRVAEDCRRAVEEAVLAGGPDKVIRATISLGAAAFERGMRSYDDLIKQADLALYRAKDGGRNRVCSSRPAPMLKAV